MGNKETESWMDEFVIDAALDISNIFHGFMF